MTTLAAVRKSGIGSVALLLAVALVCAGYLLLFSTFQFYDDEGYVALSLRDFHRLGGLYTRVYSQYGPFFYVWWDTVRSVLGFEWTTRLARLLTLIHWLGTAAACAWIVQRRAASWPLALFCFVATFALMIRNVDEPGHPGSFIVFLVALAALLGVHADLGCSRRSAGLVGGIAAAVGLIKINVGGFLGIAAIWWLLLGLPACRRSGWLRFGLYAAMATLPWGMMGRSLADVGVLEFATIICVAVFSVAVAREVTRGAAAAGGAVLAFATGAALVGAGTLALALVSGTTPGALLHGIVIAPLAHPRINPVPVHWWPGAAALAVAALGICLWFQRSKVSTIAGHVVAVVRFGLGAAVLTGVVLRPEGVANFVFSFGVGLAGVLALPLRDDAAGQADARARNWLAMVLVLQSLHAFPTAGTQVGWGSFLGVPLLLLALRDGWLHLAGRHARLVGLSGALPGIALLGAVAAAGHLLVVGVDRFNAGIPLELPGTGGLRLPGPRVAALRALAENARRYGDPVFSLGGMFSFNLWSGRPTPTGANATAWPLLLNDEEQSRIRARLEASPMAVVIRRPWIFGGGALVDYLDREFEPAFTVGEYSFHVHHGRRIAALFIGEIEASGAGEMHLTLRLPHLPRPITAIELRRSAVPGHSLLARLDVRTTGVTSTPIAEDGRALGQPAAVAWPIDPPAGIVSLSLPLAAWVPAAGEAYAVLYSADRPIGAAVILP